MRVLPESRKGETEESYNIALFRNRKQNRNEGTEYDSGHVIMLHRSHNGDNVTMRNLRDSCHKIRISRIFLIYKISLEQWVIGNSDTFTPSNLLVILIIINLLGTTKEGYSSRIRAENEVLENRMKKY